MKKTFEQKRPFHRQKKIECLCSYHSEQPGKKNRAIQKQGDKDQGNNRNRECSSEKENKSVPRGREFTQINMESYSPGLITEDG